MPSDAFVRGSAAAGMQEEACFSDGRRYGSHYRSLWQGGFLLKLLAFLYSKNYNDLNSQEINAST